MTLNKFFMASLRRKVNAGALDAIPTPLVYAYSLRKLRSGYQGACMQVQCGTVTADIGFVNGYLDTAALSALATSQAASSIRVTTWYDQSGQEMHAVSGANNIYIFKDNALTRNTEGIIGILYENSQHFSLPSSVYNLSAASFHTVFSQRSGESGSFNLGGQPLSSHTPWSDGVAYWGFLTSLRVNSAYSAYGYRGMVCNTGRLNSSSLQLYRNRDSLITANTLISPPANTGLKLPDTAYGSAYNTEFLVFSGYLSGAEVDALVTGSANFYGFSLT